MSTQVATIQPNQRASLIVTDPVHVLDTGRFEQMQRVAAMMAECSTIPDSFRFEKGDPTKAELPAKTVIANCFRVVNQAVRWGFDPFAVMDCASIIHGKLMWEGKLIHAVLKSSLGIDLDYELNVKTGRDLGIKVSAMLPNTDKVRSIEGTVAQWHRGPKSPWANEADWPRQLRYRGAREWARAYAPHVVLGIYGDDEVDTSEPIARVLRDITPEPPVPDVPTIDITAPEPLQEMTAAEAAAILHNIRSDVEGVTDPEIIREHADGYADIIDTLPEKYAAQARALLSPPQQDTAPQAPSPPADHEQPAAAAGDDAALMAKAERIIANLERAPNKTTLAAICKQVDQSWPETVKGPIRKAAEAAKARLAQPSANGAAA